MDEAQLERIQRVIDHEVRGRFLPGAVERAVLLQYGDDPAVGPGQLLVRVFIPAPGEPENYAEALAGWQASHQAGIDEMRRELSLRLPAARLLEFTFDAPGAVPANAGPAIAAAMELVAGTYALIIDLRRNGGGSPEGVVFWCSYLFGEEPTHLNDIFRTDTGETRQFWSLPYLPGSRYVDRPVYVLTSSRTFSGGEDFCYTLQALGRAQLIAEITGGGAHPTRPFGISPAVHIAIPFARSVNPVTGTNWQGSGVVPDVAVPDAEAYDTAYTAYTKALRHVLTIDAPPPVLDEARDALAALAGPGLADAGPAGTELADTGLADTGLADTGPLPQAGWR